MKKKPDAHRRLMPLAISLGVKGPCFSIVARAAVCEGVRSGACCRSRLAMRAIANRRWEARSGRDGEVVCTANYLSELSPAKRLGGPRPELRPAAQPPVSGYPASR